MSLRLKNNKKEKKEEKRENNAVKFNYKLKEGNAISIFQVNLRMTPHLGKC